MRRFAVILVAGLALAGPVEARQSIGIYDGWGVFRDAPPTRCYAIAEAEGKASGAWQPFATISWWPERGVKGQLHFRLSRERRDGADVMLRIGNRRWRLTPGRADAWSPSPRHDAFMLARGLWTPIGWQVLRVRSMPQRCHARGGGRSSPTPVMLNLFQHPCLNSCVRLTASRLASNLRHGP